MSGVSAASIGTGSRVLPPGTIAAIETICAPEMACLGYPPTGARGGLEQVTEPCAAPRPALSGHVWGAGALALERRRLDALRDGRYDPALHLSDRAFAALTAGTPLPFPEIAAP